VAQKKTNYKDYCRLTTLLRSCSFSKVTDKKIQNMLSAYWPNYSDVGKTPTCII